MSETRLAAWLREHDMRAYQLAEALGMGRTFVYDLARGTVLESGKPGARLTTLMLVSAHTGIPVGVLAEEAIGGTHEQH